MIVYQESIVYINHQQFWLTHWQLYSHYQNMIRFLKQESYFNQCFGGRITSFLPLIKHKHIYTS